MPTEYSTQFFFGSAIAHGFEPKDPRTHSTYPLTSFVCLLCCPSMFSTTPCFAIRSWLKPRPLGSTSIQQIWRNRRSTLVHLSYMLAKTENQSLTYSHSTLLVHRPWPKELYTEIEAAGNDVRNPVHGLGTLHMFACCSVKPPAPFGHTICIKPRHFFVPGCRTESVQQS